VAGIGKIDGRPIAVVGEDYTIKGGSDSGGGRRAAQGRAGRLH
jgi:acetyl-CoA carboxylase carboxyltransferase component